MAKAKAKVAEAPVAEAPVAEAPVAEAPVAEALGTLGKLKVKILSVRDKQVNGRDYKEVRLADNATYLLSPEDFEAQKNS